MDIPGSDTAGGVRCSDLIRDRLAGTSTRRGFIQLIFVSVDQAAVERRQEAAVKDIRTGRPLAEFEFLGDLIDRAFESRCVDAADAVAPDLAGQDVVVDDGA